MLSIEEAALQDMAGILDRAIAQISTQAIFLVRKGDINALLKLHAGLGVALQRPLMALWRAGWYAGERDGLEDVRAQIPPSMAQFAIADDIAIKIAEVFRAIPGVFRNLQAERAVQRRVLRLAGQFAQDVLDGVKADILASIKATIDRPELLRKLQARLKVGKARAQAIARTETTAAYNKGRLSSYKESKLVTHVVFMAIRDERTTLICRSRDGMVIPVGDRDAIALNTPPCHVQCRSVLSPLLSVTARGKRLIGDESRLYSNRVLDPLPKGWRVA